jgi:hypothetical protein
VTRRWAVFTPGRLLVLVVVILAAAITLYGLVVVKSAPLYVSSLAVLGISLVVLGVMAAAASVRSARNGSGGAAFVAALVGGLCMLAAAGALSMAIILGLLIAG